MSHLSLLKVLGFTVVFFVVLTGGSERLIAKEKPEKSGDYPKVDKVLAPVIQAMPSGTSESPIKIPWRLFAPQGATQGGTEKFPLIFFLHGAGARGDDNISPMYLAKTFWEEKNQKQYPCFVLAPQFPRGSFLSPIPWATEEKRARGNYVAEEKPYDSLQAAFNILDKIIAEWPVDKKRIYVMGMSMGGYGTWESLMRRPDQWAAAVPICGGGDPSKVSSYKDIPIWAWHGANDPIVPPATSRAMVEELKKAGGNPKYTELERVGHGSWDPAFETPELYSWLFSQKRP